MVHVKVDKQKFDVLLDRLIQTPPIKREEIKTGPKKARQVIEPKPQTRTAPAKASQ
jgi:hypothetical protein